MRLLSLVPISLAIALAVEERRPSRRPAPRTTVGPHGWPTVTYGIDYSGAPIGDGVTSLPGVEQPLYYWDPVIAPSGAAF